jgi:hypothetical protein
MFGIFIINKDDKEALADLNKATRDWEMRAARGECGWICADCCASFSNGMPDACTHGHQSCTDIIQRDKRQAAEPKEPTP